MLWRIRLLGELALERDDALPVTHFRSRKTAALVAYFALFPGQHARERLLDRFWPDDPPARAQQSLRASLASLRRQLEPPGVRPGSVLLATRTHAGLNRAAFTTDLAELEAALQAGDYAAVQRLATGPLLPDVYDDWAVTAAAALAARLESLSPAPAPAAAAPAPPEARHRRIGVPPSLDRFFGRDEEQERVTALLEAGTPLTLTGAGGNGKTRLAARIAQDWKGTAVFLSLAEARDAAEIPERLARLLETPVESLIETLEAEPSPLLVLDNVEQVVGVALRTAATRLRTDLPALRVLATSRQRLGLPGERLVPLRPLPLPDPDALLESLAGVPSVALFVDRGQACRGDFQLTLRNAAAVADLVRLLEGVPLAIELAASWIGALTPAQIAEKIRQSRLALTARRSRGTRHDSLWAVAHSSYALLSEELRQLFVGLSVFHGGATLEAIARVCDPPAVEEAVVRLTERSLLRQSPTDPPRFFLPEALREFAAERRGDGRLIARHRACFVAHAEALEAELATARQSQVLTECDADYDNFASALEAALADPTREGAEDALRLVGALWRFWESRGRLREAEAALTAALAHPLGVHETLRESRAKALGGLGLVLLRRRDFAGARARQEAALALRRELGETTGIAVSLYNLGSVASASADFPRAVALFDEAIALLEPTGDTHRLCVMLTARGNLEVRRKEPLRGLPYLESARRVQTAAGDVLGLIYTLLALAALRYETGDLDAELRLYEEALPLCVATHDVVNGATALLNLADSLSEQDADPERFVYLAALGESARRKHGIPLLPADHARRERLAPLLADPHLAAAWARGEAADWTRFASDER